MLFGLGWYRAALMASAISTIAAVVAPVVQPLRAQSTEFSLSTGAVVFPTPVPANYSSWPASASGPVTDSVAVPFTVARTANNTWRLTTVLIRCQSATAPRTCGDYEWRNGATGPWQPLTLTDAEVESRWVIPFWFNDPWSNTLWLRVRLDVNDPAPTLVTSNIVLTLTVSRL